MLRTKALIAYYFQLRSEVYEMQKMRANLKYYRVLVAIPSLILIMALKDHLVTPLLILVPSILSLLIDVFINNYTASIIRIAKYNRNRCEPELSKTLKIKEDIFWENFMSRYLTRNKLALSYVANGVFTLSLTIISFMFYHKLPNTTPITDLYFWIYLFVLMFVEVCSLYIATNTAEPKIP